MAATPEKLADRMLTMVHGLKGGFSIGFTIYCGIITQPRALKALIWAVKSICMNTAFKRRPELLKMVLMMNSLSVVCFMTWVSYWFQLVMVKLVMTNTDELLYATQFYCTFTAAALLRPYISEENHWILSHHEIFQVRHKSYMNKYSL